MNLDQYRVKWGKLTNTIQFNVDDNFYSLVEQCKEKKFDFNAWARDTLANGMSDLKSFLEKSDAQ